MLLLFEEIRNNSIIFKEANQKTRGDNGGCARQRLTNGKDRMLRSALKSQFPLFPDDKTIREEDEAKWLI